MSLVLPSVKGSPLTCSEYENNLNFILDLSNATGELDCAKINQASLTTCLLANSVIINLQTEIDNTQNAVSQVAQDLIDAQTTLQTNINNLTTIVNNQNITIADLYSQINSLLAQLTDLTNLVSTFDSRLINIEGRVTTLEAALATGIILIWSSSLGSIPSAYVICNGLNGTPDLRNRFVIGAGISYVPNNTGGSATHAHNITGYTGDTSLTVDQLPAHSHTVNDLGHQHMTQSPGYPEGPQGFQPGGAGGDVGTSPTLFATTGIYLSNTGSNGGHNHPFSGTVDTAGNLPPYYALFYIMKV